MHKDPELAAMFEKLADIRKSNCWTKKAPNKKDPIQLEIESFYRLKSNVGHVADAPSSKEPE